MEYVSTCFPSCFIMSLTFRLQYTTFGELLFLKVNLLDSTFSWGRCWGRSIAAFPLYQYSGRCRRSSYCTVVVPCAPPVSDRLPKVNQNPLSRLMTSHNSIRSEAMINKLVRSHSWATRHDDGTEFDALDVVCGQYGSIDEVWMFFIQLYWIWMLTFCNDSISALSSFISVRLNVCIIAEHSADRFTLQYMAAPNTFIYIGFYFCIGRRECSATFPLVKFVFWVIIQYTPTLCWRILMHANWSGKVQRTWQAINWECRYVTFRRPPTWVLRLHGFVFGFSLRLCRLAATGWN